MTSAVDDGSLSDLGTSPNGDFFEAVIICLKGDRYNRSQPLALPFVISELMN